MMSNACGPDSFWTSSTSPIAVMDSQSRIFRRMLHVSLQIALAIRILRNLQAAWRVASIRMHQRQRRKLRSGALPNPVQL